MSHSVPFHLEALHSTSRADMQNLNHKYEAGDLYDPFSQFRQAHSKSEEPRIPAASLFQTLAGPQDEEAAKGRHASPLLDMPSVGECAVHLELLEVFFAVRTRIINSSELDNTFDVKNKPRTVYRREIDRKTAKYTDVPHQIKDTNWPQRRRSKWIYYLHIAVGRFMFWARSADAAIKLSSKSGSSSTLVHIPPFDVLMVWHAFLLNPGDYKRYCYQSKLKHLYRVSFPWDRIHEAIDNRALTYTLPTDSATWTATVARMTPDLYEFLASNDIPDHISKALLKYGKLHETLLWQSRPRLQHSVATDHLSVAERGFIDAFLAATREKALAESLVANVQRQASFVDKMHRHLWLRSPAIEGTVRRAIRRYDEFLQLFNLSPGTVLVPTLDIDLAWHTHQLSPLQYAAGCETRAGRFIDHDDKIVQGRLDSGYDKTKELYQLYFGKMYAVCHCWDCEGITSALERAEEEHDEMLDSVDMDVLADETRREVAYYRVVEMVRRKGAEELLPVQKMAT